MKEYAMLLDTTFCTGCNSCTYRCIQEFRYHDLASQGLFRGFVYINDGGLYHKRCMHCLDPECVKNCPVEALTKSEYGPVLYDAKKCIGCKTCTEACPFGIPQFDSASEKIIRCSLCAHRVGEGKQPACAEVCPTGAIQFGEYAVVVEKAKTLAAKNRMHIYGLDEAGGTRLLILSKETPAAAGYPKIAAKPVKVGSAKGQEALAIPAFAALAIGGMKKFSDRRARIESEEEEK